MVLFISIRQGLIEVRKIVYKVNELWLIIFLVEGLYLSLPIAIGKTFIAEMDVISLVNST